MFRTRLAMLVVAGTLLSAAASGCRSGSSFEGTQQPDNRVGLVVKNDNYSDMDVYAVGDGLATRVGTVPGLLSRTFSIHESYFKGTDVRIVATPIGGNGRASTGPITASVGDTIYFNINPTLRASTVSIH